jgi:hypothetical protein
VQEAIWEYGLHKPGDSTILYETVVAAADQKFMSRKPRTVMVLFTDGVDTGSKNVTDEESIEFLKDSNVLTYCIQHFSMDHYWRTNFPASEEPDLTRLPAPGGGKMGPIFVGGRGANDRDWAEYKIKRIHDRAVTYLGRVARAGGGEHIQLAAVGELEKAYGRIYEDLANVYTVCFGQPGGDSPVRTFTVTTTREGAVPHLLPKKHWSTR